MTLKDDYEHHPTSTYDHGVSDGCIPTDGRRGQLCGEATRLEGNTANYHHAKLKRMEYLTTTLGRWRFSVDIELRLSLRKRSADFDQATRLGRTNISRDNKFAGVDSPNFTYRLKWRVSTGDAVARFIVG